MTSSVKQGEMLKIRIAQELPSSRCLKNLYVCVYVCPSVYTVNLCKGQRSTTPGAIAHELHPPYFGAGTLINLCLTKLDRLAGHQAPGTLLSLLLQDWHYKHIAPHLAFKIWVLRFELKVLVLL